jgi:hypothetical protein
MTKNSESDGPSPAVSPKPGKHPIFGELKDTTFIRPGVDLTEPADPDWGKVYDENDSGLAGEK